MYDHILVESEKYSLDLFNKSELEFIKSKNLITEKDNMFYPNFVGEFLTPEKKVFSLPKNFETTQPNIELFKKVLKEYRNFKKDGKTLITNSKFVISDDGVIKSEKFYFEELKEFFLDFITYGFIYPAKKLKVHSKIPIKDAKVDVVSTFRNRKRKGIGVTYKVNDIENSDEWNLDDIYWSTIKELASKYGTEKDIRDIKEVKEVLDEEGYKIKQIDISDTQKIVEDIKNCDVGIIHKPIKKILLSYFKSKLVGEAYNINIFYTSNFEYVWEELIRRCLKHSEKFKNSFEDLVVPIKKFIGVDKEEKYRDLIPDLFSEWKGKKFIGDSKYYKNPEDSHFDKEMYVYNTTFNNEYPMCVFVPSNKTKVIDVRKQGPFELIVFKISAKEAIYDAVHKRSKVISEVQNLISKSTSRKGDYFDNGF